MINLSLYCFLESRKNTFSLGARLAPWATVIGVFGGTCCGKLCIKNLSTQ